MGFIDDVVKNINQGINEIQSKSQEMMQQMSINARIRTLEERKQQLLINIGQLIFDRFEKGDEVSDDLLRDKTREIAEIEKEIELAKHELKEANAASADASRAQKAAYGAGYKPTPGFTCPHCGSPANATKFYCVSCGGALKESSGESGGSSENGGSSGSGSSQQNFNPNGSDSSAS